MIISIDGGKYSCEKGEYLLDIARRNGIFIPTLCHHEGLPGRGACRICVVEVETGGRQQVVAACIYPVEKEIVVYTNSVRIKNYRRMILSLLNARAPESAEISNLCAEYGASAPERFVHINEEKCILCGLCVMTCESVGSSAISTVGRGTEKAVSTPYNEPSKECVGCLSCANICPAGAIETKEDETSREIWGKSFTLIKCGNCGKNVGTEEEITLVARKSGEEARRLCPDCLKKKVTDILAEAFGE